MPRPPKRRAFLVSVQQEHEVGRVYAVLASMPDEALKAVALVIPPGAQVEIVGGLSRDLAMRLHLKTGVPLQI
jgi:hypothetical protein